MSAGHMQDPKKFARVRELLHLQQEIAAARKASMMHAVGACSCYLEVSEKLPLYPCATTVNCRRDLMKQL